VASTLHLHHITSLENSLEFLFRVILGYLQLAADLTCTALFFNPQQTFPLGFVLALLAVLMPTLVIVTLPGQSRAVLALTVARLRFGYEAWVSWGAQLETIEFCLVELIEAISEGFPSALLQLHAVLYRQFVDSATRIELLGPEYVLYVGVGVSVLNSSWTSARLFSTPEERRCPTLVSVMLFVYYACEKLYRLLYFSIISLFISSGGYAHGYNPYLLNVVYVCFCLLVRLALVCYSHSWSRFWLTEGWDFDELWNFGGRLLMSLATSHIWFGEYILTSRLLLLELFEAVSIAPIFLWLKHYTSYETDRFNCEVPICLCAALYCAKMLLLAIRVAYTPHCRHILYNHMATLGCEAALMLLVVLLIYSLLFIYTNI